MLSSCQHHPPMTMPANCILQAVITPEQFTTADDERRRAKHAKFTGSIGLHLPKLLNAFALNNIENLLRVLADVAETSRNVFVAAGFLAELKPSAICCEGEISAPAFLQPQQCDPVCQR